MEPIKTEEFEQDGVWYVREYYDNGVTIEYPRDNEPVEPDPKPEPQTPPVTNEELQAQIAELQEQNVAIMMGLVDMFATMTNGGAE